MLASPREMIAAFCDAHAEFACFRSFAAAATDDAAGVKSATDCMRSMLAACPHKAAAFEALVDDIRRGSETAELKAEVAALKARLVELAAKPPGQEKPSSKGGAAPIVVDEEPPTPPKKKVKQGGGVSRQALERFLDTSDSDREEPTPNRDADSGGEEPAPKKRQRAPLTQEQRDEKNAKERLRRAALKQKAD